MDSNLTPNSEERWKPIVGWEGLYSVSDRGRVKSVERLEHRVNGQIRRRDELIRRLVDDGHGYPGLKLYRKNIGFTVKVHRLVAEAFIGPCPDGMEVRHLNGDPTDNRLSNLTYGTHSENCQDVIRHGNHHELAKTHCPSGHAYTAENVYILPSRPNARYCRCCRRRQKREAAAKARLG